jgi:hypothetical protein
MILLNENWRRFEEARREHERAAAMRRVLWSVAWALAGVGVGVSLMSLGR